jgi:tRNA pseudouridine38-40 synthase
MPRTFKLTLAYDGTDFAGWQRQATAPTVQAAVEDALLPIAAGRRVVVTGAGRTDAGVHAAGQVASVVLESAIACEALQRALNATLDPAVRVLRVDEMRADFNAQFDARAKTYRYCIWTGAVVLPQARRYVWHVPQALDTDAMSAAAGILVGAHDFATFQASGSDVQTTTRELVDSHIAREPLSGSLHGSPQDAGALLVYEVTGTGFLRHMVRNIVGTLVEIGRGRRGASDMTAILASRTRASAGETAPPQGLTLWEVHYW